VSSELVHSSYNLLHEHIFHFFLGLAVLSLNA
jgi:hypothetical protein